MTDYVLGTTIILQTIYYDKNDNPIDADASPPVRAKIQDARGRVIQTDLIATKTAAGTYQYKYRTAGLAEGTYYFIFTGYFDGDPDNSSGSFTLKSVV